VPAKVDYNGRAGCDPTYIKMLMCAPTGKAVTYNRLNFYGRRNNGLSPLDSRLKQIFSNVDAPSEVIVLGDLRQFRPVCDRWIFQPPSHDLYTETTRQQDDQPFAIALNNMASGQMLSDDIGLLRTRISDESKVPNDSIRLFLGNQDTDQYNMEKLNSIPTDQFNSEAIGSVKFAQRSSEQRTDVWNKLGH